MTVEAIFTEAFALSPDQRVELASRLLQSLPPAYARNATANILASVSDPLPGPPLSENPFWPAFLAAMEENRRKADAENKALYATEP